MIEGLESVLNRLESLKGKTSRQIGAIASNLLSEAVTQADRHTKTGRLVNALQLKKTGDYGYEIYSDKNMAPYAAFVHFKTKAHDITPKNGKFLRFAQGGNFVFAKKVRHPGYAGDPYLYRAAKLVSQRIQQIIERTE